MNTRPGLSEAAFRRFEPAIRVACKNFPTKVQVEKCDLSTLTCTARLRDALRSHRLNGWSTTWDHSNLPKLTVTNEGDKVFIGGPQQKVLTKITGNIAVSGIKDLGATELNAFCVLISGGHLQGPILFRWACSAPFDQLVYEANFNISITKEADCYVLT